jgi:hypothetical protein
MGVMIPDEALVAAAYALYRDANPDSELKWYDIGFHEQDELLRPARGALEAAAPYILADAWDEGYREADYDAPHSDKTPNPYRRNLG